MVLDFAKLYFRGSFHINNYLRRSRTTGVPLEFRHSDDRTTISLESYDGTNSLHDPFNFHLINVT